MCLRLFLGTAKLILNVFNVIHLLVGLGLASFGLYLELTYGSTFSEMTIIIGCVVVVTAIAGLFAVKTSSYCLLTTYAILMALLFLANLIILIISYSDFNTLLGKIQSSSDKVDKAKTWITNHKETYQYLQLGLVVVEFVCFALGLFYRRNEPLKRNYSEMNDDDYDGEVSLQPHNDLDETPLTDSQKKRAAIREKYGFRKTSEGGSSTKNYTAV